jgi:EAL domain-containing protein (putative c-di-GMP-specific phosphodiesterase class I)
MAFEALLRRQDAQAGDTAPVEFIPITEDGAGIHLCKTAASR